MMIRFLTGLVLALACMTLTAQVDMGERVRHSNGLLIKTGMPKGELIKKFPEADEQSRSVNEEGEVREEWIYRDGEFVITVILRESEVDSVRRD